MSLCLPEELYICPLSLSVMFIVSTVSHEAVSNENMHDLASLFYTTKLLDPCYLM